ncbi:MurR/RpiR family transcriptional regulator [Enterococcus gallinarum]|uniref:MurR/RpiR family transcriptional regulator n=1 Tax=Enterococcus gallinarum TaxID=1353 RepID=UPI003369D144
MDVEMLIDKYQLNDSEAEVLRFMKKNRQSLKTIGIRDVAKATYVSTATIINMAKKIGYSGYSELVFALGNSQSDIAMPYTPQRISDYQPNLFFGTTLNQFELLLSAALKAIFE